MAVPPTSWPWITGSDARCSWKEAKIPGWSHSDAHGFTFFLQPQTRSQGSEALPDFKIKVLSREKQDATLNLNNTRSSSEQAKCSGFDISEVTCIHHKSMGVWHEKQAVLEEHESKAEGALSIKVHGVFVKIFYLESKVSSIWLSVSKNTSGFQYTEWQATHSRTYPKPTLLAGKAERWVLTKMPGRGSLKNGRPLFAPSPALLVNS